MMLKQNKKDVKNESAKKAGLKSKFGLLSLLALIFVVLVVLNLTPIAIVVATRKIPIYCVERTDNAVALTFDAAWGADKTEQILDICKKNDVKVTFFLVGFWTEKYPQLVKRIYDEGHAIGTHSETHPKMTTLSLSKQAEELNGSIKKIVDVTGGKVRLFRPPFGDYNNSVIETASGLGLSTIQWSVDSLDWKGLSGRDIAARVLKAKAGDIILCHNNSDHIVDALPVIIQGLKDKGLKLVTVEELIYYENYYVDHTGKQIKNNTNVD